MSIQNRRGASKDFDASKMLPGEFGFSTDGTRKLYAAFGPNDVKELASKDDVQGLINSFSQVVDKEISEAEQRIESKGQQVLGTIPDLYEEVSARADEAIRTKADAIVCTVSGVNPIAKDSSNDYLRNLKLYGKTTQGENPSPSNQQPLESKGKWGNLIDDSSVKGYTVVGDKYTPTMNGKLISGNVFAVVTFTDGTTGTYENTSLTFDTTDGERHGIALNSTTEVTEEDVKIFKCFNLYFNNVAEGKVIKSVMVNTGTTALPYRPYSGQKEIESGVYGKNLLGEIKRNIVVDSSTGLEQSNNNGMSTDFIRVTPNTPYTMSIYKACLYNKNRLFDKNKKIINANILFTLDTVGSTTAIIPENVHYIRFEFDYKDGFDSTTKDFAQFEKGDKATPYEPYTKQSHISLVGDGLKGIPVTDSSLATYTDEKGQMICSDVTDYEKRVDVQRIGTRKANNDWFIVSGYNKEDSALFAIGEDNVLDIKESDARYLCNKLSYKTVKDTNETGFYYAGGHFFARIKGVSDVATFNSLMGDAEFQYILAEPIETPLSASELESYKALHSNYHVTTVMNDCDCYSEVSYNADTEIWITNKIEERITKAISNLTI